MQNSAPRQGRTDLFFYLFSLPSARLLMSIAFGRGFTYRPRHAAYETLPQLKLDIEMNEYHKTSQVDAPVVDDVDTPEDESPNEKVEDKNVMQQMGKRQQLAVSIRRTGHLRQPNARYRGGLTASPSSVSVSLY